MNEVTLSLRKTVEADFPLHLLFPLCLVGVTVAIGLARVNATPATMAIGDAQEVIRLVSVVIPKHEKR